MGDEQLGDYLLRLDVMDLAGMSDARREAMKIVERDRRRVRRLTAVTLVLWALVTAATGFVLWIYSIYLPRETQLLQDLGARGDTIEGANLSQSNLILISVVSKGTVFVAGSVGLLALAMLTTVVLVLSARKATLRQVSASLLEISDQLKALRQALPKPPAGGV